jgi:SlyX protein
MPAERINMNLEDRLIALETKITAQEDLLDVLNQTVYQQHKKIDELENLCITLARRLADAQYTEGGGALLANEKPPHY